MPKKPTCFIIQPLSTPVEKRYPKKNHFLTMLNRVSIPAVKAIGFQALGPLESGGFEINRRILDRLLNSNLVLCDISAFNPNVFFELGIRRALNKPFAIIRDEYSPPPFDVRPFNYLKYDSTAVHDIRKRKTLINDLTEHLLETVKEKTPPAESLIGAVSAGVTRIFPSRQDAMKDILGDLENVSRRLWIMGVGLSEDFRLSHHLDNIEDKIKRARQRGKKFDARVLILDALTSTGVFRSLLESKAEGVRRMVNAWRQPEEDNLDEPYFSERLYRDFHNTWNWFKGHEALENVVRFYGHAPTGWLIMVDDTAYFEPYTFGSDPNSKKRGGYPIGPLMPVFRFEGSGNGRPFRVLEKHFLRLWLTTDTDLFHVRARDAEASEAVTKIFQNRGYWLRQVLSTLHKPTGERRKFPRKVCRSKLENYVSRNTRSEPKVEESVLVDAVLNFSRQGLAFKLHKARLLQIKLPVKEGSRIRVLSRIPAEQEGAKNKQKAGEFVKKELVDRYDGKFRVVHKREAGDFVVVGLKPIKTNSRH